MNRSSIVFPVIFAALGFASSCSLPSSNISQTNNGPTNGTSAVQNKQLVSSNESKSDITGAVADFNSGNYEKAILGFQEVVKSDPKNLDAHLYLGKSFHLLKKDDDAINSFKQAVQIKPENANANFALGTIYYSRKQYETSLPYFDRAVKTNFKSPEMLMALGENQRVLKQFDRAIVQYGKVIGFEPNNANAYYGLGLTYIGLKNKIAARQQLQKLEPLNRDLAKKLSDEIGS